MGMDMASWSSNDGLYHIMEVTQKITHVPDIKKHVVVGQIHDASDDIFYASLRNKETFSLSLMALMALPWDSDYQLGTTFTFKVEVYNNEMKFYYNGNLMHTTTTNSFSGAYFKAGMYTLSHHAKEANTGKWREL